MTTKDYKQYTQQAKSCIKGEAFFESLISDYSIPHHVSSPKDVGIDYFCEWVFDDKPTGVLYAVQIKTLSSNNVQVNEVGIDEKQNGLTKFRIVNSNLKIEDRTLYYWKGLAIPIYLFVIIYKQTSSGEKLDCFYKRYTPYLTKTATLKDSEFYIGFYKVNKANTFLAFKDSDIRKQGFARDLFIDYIRWNYFKGSIAYLNPRSIGLNQFPEVDNIFPELFEWYSEKIKHTYNKLKLYIEDYCESDIPLDPTRFSTMETSQMINMKNMPSITKPKK